jgi:uncharacterized protein YecE (DUF72 family)
MAAIRIVSRGATDSDASFPRPQRVGRGLDCLFCYAIDGRDARPTLRPDHVLPGTLKKDLERLTAFLGRLNRSVRHAIEFRHPSWLDEEVFDVLRRYHAANVALSSQAMPMCLEITADFVYVRFHGLEGGATHNYTDRELKPWATFLQKCTERGVPGFVYFNNDMNTRAPLNALRLMELLGPPAVPAQQ